MAFRRHMQELRRSGRRGAVIAASLAALGAATLAATASDAQVPVDPTDPQLPPLPGGDEPDPPASSPPPAPSRPAPKRLSPFPVVVITGSEAGRVTRVTALVVRGPEGAFVRARCRGGGCPLRRTGGTIGAERRLRLRRAERAYRAGAALVIRVFDEDEERIGKYTRIRFRRDLTPARTDACLQPGDSEPSPCP